MEVQKEDLRKHLELGFNEKIENLRNEKKGVEEEATERLVALVEAHQKELTNVRLEVKNVLREREEMHDADIGKLLAKHNKALEEVKEEGMRGKMRGGHDGTYRCWLILIGTLIVGCLVLDKLDSLCPQH